MTRVHIDCKKCEDCVWYAPLLKDLIGTCEGTHSDHFGHFIAPEHPTCDAMVRKA